MKKFFSVIALFSLITISVSDVYAWGSRGGHHSWDQNGGGSHWNQNGGGNHWNQNGGGSGGLDRLIQIVRLFLNNHNNNLDKNGGGNGGTNGGGNSVPELSATSGPIALALLSGIIGIGLERRRRLKIK